MTKEDFRVPTESSIIVILLQLKEQLRTRAMSTLWWIDTRDMLAYGLNKGLISRAALLNTPSTGLWKLEFPAVKFSEVVVKPVKTEV